ncbi:hypothetical protein [Nonomuraea basaltis]|uniref:hypothetical protein n=1 Tax=Nonomuraea basaltis TaxID=2495887 RepID=UPI00110C513D|nr:hypothetical protein [Nonomuraea basaltis]TMR92834.1 hypothetical protein EJK15_42530 [Nonomuraea basaltis]
MTTVITGPSALLIAEPNTIRSLFEAVLPHVAVNDDDNDDYHPPILTSVHIEVRDGHLLLVGSDRYTLAVVRWPLTVTTPDFTARFAVEGESIRGLLAELPAKAVSLRIEPGQLTVRNDGWTKTLPVSTRWADRLPWQSVARRHGRIQDAEHGRAIVQPALLARFSSAARLLDLAVPPMVVHVQNETRHLVVTLGTVFLGLAAHPDTKRYRDGEIPAQPLNAWTDLLSEA